MNNIKEKIKIIETIKKELCQYGYIFKSFDLKSSIDGLKYVIFIGYNKNLDNLIDLNINLISFKEIKNNYTFKNIEDLEKFILNSEVLK